MVHEKSMIFTPTAFHIFRPSNTKQLHELQTLTVSPLTEPMAGRCDTTVFHTDRSTECIGRWPETPRAVQIHHWAEWPGKSSNQIIRWRVVCIQVKVFFIYNMAIFLFFLFWKISEGN